MPVTPVIDGMGILAAGLLLITPGLLTHAIGFLLFIPPIRRALAKWLFNKALSSGRVHIRTFGQTSTGQPRSEPPRPRGGAFARPTMSWTRNSRRLIPIMIPPKQSRSNRTKRLGIGEAARPGGADHNSRPDCSRRLPGFSRRASDCNESALGSRRTA